MRTKRKNTISENPFLKLDTLESLSFLSATGQTFLIGIFSLGPNSLIVTKIREEMTIKMKLTNTRAPS